MEQYNTKLENPWKGLQSYREGEILYGRDDDIRDLTQCVLRDKYTLLYGKSGIGKSSILNAAIVPTLRRKGFVPIVIRLSHEDQNVDYLSQINKAISESLGKENVREEVDKKGSEESIYEFFHRHTFWNKDNTRAKLFIMFDQFEEMFTIQTDEAKKKEFFGQLASLCNNIKPDYLLSDQSFGSETDISYVKQEEDESIDDEDFVLPDMDSIEYVDDNDVRMIFTIREDSLSEFDFYAANISSLKHNRYYLRPINEEQAAQIIMRPYPGLVDKDTAWLIISKVTERADFTIDSKPELEVNSAILSLYLSRLFDLKPQDSPITEKIVEQKGSDIIANYYKDAISAVSIHTIEYLEKELLTSHGRRKSISVEDAKKDGHVTDEELAILIDKKKILRKYTYAKDLKIEYAHDILCPVVQAHVKDREEKKQQIINEKKIANLRKRNRLLLFFASLILLSGIIVYVFFGGGIIGSSTGRGELTKIPIRIFEDESVKDYWRAELLITGFSGLKKDTLLWNKSVNDTYKDSTLYINIDSVKKVSVLLKFDRPLFEDVYTTINVQDFSDMPNIWITIRRKEQETFDYSSKVVTKIGNSEIPLQNAIIVIRDKVFRTQEDGSFNVQLASPLPLEKGNFYIVKEGFDIIEKEVNEVIRDDKLVDVFQMKLIEDRIVEFEKQCSEMDSLLGDKNTEWEYWKNAFDEEKGFAYVSSDSTRDIICMVARALRSKRKQERISIIGIYYLKTEYDKFKALGHPHYAYHIFMGNMDKGKLIKGGMEEKSFDFESFDIFNNRHSFSGVHRLVEGPQGELRNALGVTVGVVGK